MDPLLQSINQATGYSPDLGTTSGQLYQQPAPTPGFTDSYTPLPYTAPSGGSYDPTYSAPAYSAPAPTYIQGVNDPSTLAAYDQSIANTQAAYDRTGTQLNSGYTNVDNSYNSALQQLLQGFNVANRNYGTAKQTAATDYVGAKNTVGSQAGNSLNGLLRLLGSRGAGGSSAALYGAPQAVARGASIQRNDIGNTFGRNNQALDTNWGDYNNAYNQQVSGAGTQRDTARQNLENSINNNRATLLQSLAQLQAEKAAATGGSATGAAQPYLNQANSILNGLASTVTPQITYQTQAYKAPDLASYNTTPQAAPTYNSTGASDYFAPALQSLLGKKQQTAGA